MGLFRLFRERKKEDFTLPVKTPQEPDFLQAIDKSTGAAINEEVEPELALWLSNGVTVKGLKELAPALRKISAKAYKEHVNPERNEVAEWVQEVLNNHELAKSLRKSKTKLQAAGFVEREIRRIKLERQTAKKEVAMQKRQAKKQAEQALLPEPEPTIPDFAGLAPPQSELDVPERKSFWPFKKKKQKEQQEALPEPTPLPEPMDVAPAMTETIEVATDKKKPGFSLFGRKKGKKEAQEITPANALPEMPDEEMPDAAFDSFEAEPQHEVYDAPQEEFASADEERLEQPPAETTSQRKSYASRKEKHAKATLPEPEEDGQLSRRERELGRIEKALDEEESRLNAQRLDLTRRRYELIKQKGDIERKKFEEFMHRHRKTPTTEISMDATSTQPASSREMPVRGLPNFRLADAYGKERLESLLEEAKQRIRENNFEEAQRALSEVQSVFDTVYMSNNEKKQIEYEILEVEADLRLASLR